MHLSRHAVLIVVGLVLIGAFVALTIISPHFFYGGPPIERPFIPMIAILMGAGLFYLAGIGLLNRMSATGFTVAWIVFVGLAMRGITLASDPIIEDDFYRYLWDGAVLAHGHNPYAYIPGDVLSDWSKAGIPTALHELAEESGIVGDRVNHAYLGTLYPPVAQLFFAGTYFVRPWSLGAWRAVLLAVDISVFLLVVVLLRRTGRPVHYVAIYWWNPVVVKEIINSAHMDVLVLPFALLALYFALRNRTLFSALSLAASIGTKLWPVILAPALIASLRPSRKSLTIALTAGTLLLAALFAPALAARTLGESSGFFAYSERWEMNDALFMGFLKVSQGAVSLTDAQDPKQLSNIVARVLVLCVVIAWALHLAVRGRIEKDGDLVRQCLLVIGVLFLLSPTQFPWYYVWMVPFLALCPRASFLSLSVTMPMYYLKFYFDAHGNVDFFHNVVVWIEYSPVFLLLAYEIYRARARRQSAETVAGA